MRHISTKLQKKIMFIPLVNICNYFIAIHNCGKAQNSGEMKFKMLAVAIGTLLPFTFLCSYLTKIFPMLEDVIFLCAVYIGPLIIGYGTIKIQEDFLIIEEK